MSKTFVLKEIIMFNTSKLMCYCGRSFQYLMAGYHEQPAEIVEVEEAELTTKLAIELIYHHNFSVWI